MSTQGVDDVYGILNNGRSSSVKIYRAFCRHRFHLGLLMTDVQFHPTVSSVLFVLNRIFDYMEINQIQCDLRISSLSDTWTHFGAEPPAAFVQVLGVMNEHVIVL